MKEESKRHWGKVILLGLVCGIGVAAGYDLIVTWREMRAPAPKLHIADAIGVYNWDLSEFDPPGSPRAKAFAESLGWKFLALKTDKPVYYRRAGRNEVLDYYPIMWDFKLSEEQRRIWHERIRANQPLDSRRP